MLFGALWAIHEIGRSNGKDIGQAAVDLYKAKLEDSDKVLAESREQITALKLDLQRRSDKPQIREQCSPDLPAVEQLLESDSPVNVTVTIPSGSSKSVFDGRLAISVVGLSYDASPSRFLATAAIGSTGEDSLNFANAEVGKVVNYHGFEIRIVEIGALSATFNAVKL